MTHAVQRTPGSRAPKRTCAIVDVCVLRTHGKRRAEVDERRIGRLPGRHSALRHSVSQQQRLQHIQTRQMCM